MPKRTLYQCFHARVKGDHIFCAKGHKFNSHRLDVELNINTLARGDPLALRVCQDCPDFESMGEPVPPEERGWANVERR